MSRRAADPRPRIGFIGFHTGPGGIGKDMIYLMNAIVGAGVVVDVLISEATGPDLPFLNEAINVIEFGEGGRLPRIRALTRYLRQSRPDAMVGNKERDNQALIVARRLTRSPTRVTLRVGTSKSEVLRRRHWWQRLPQRYAIIRTYRAADILICVSNGVADDALKLTGADRQNTYVLPNTSIPRDIDARAAELIDHPWLQSTGTPVILAVGRLTAQKDYPTLLAAFAELLKKRPCRLLVLGKGNALGHLQDLTQRLAIGHAVQFPGFVVNPYAYMRRASAFVLSSRWEGFGNVLVEAMAVGTPVVSTDCPHGPAEILERGRWGPIVPMGDVEALAAAMVSVLDAPLPPETLKQAAQRYRVDSVIDGYLAAMLGEKAWPNAARISHPKET